MRKVALVLRTPAGLLLVFGIVLACISAVLFVVPSSTSAAPTTPRAPVEAIAPLPQEVAQRPLVLVRPSPRVSEWGYVSQLRLKAARAEKGRIKREQQRAQKAAAQKAAKAVKPTPVARVYGGDISWPQCPVGMGIEHKKGLGLPMPTDAAKFVVVGLTNGPGFHANPCFTSQVKWVRDNNRMLGVYAVVSGPQPGQLNKYGAQGPFTSANSSHPSLANFGYAQAVFNIQTMKNNGVKVPLVWLDVEPVNYFEWSGVKTNNAAVVAGSAKAYRDAGYKLGVYSTPYMWDAIVGDLSLGSDVVEWRPASTLGEAEAIARCNDKQWSIQGGHGVLGQWIADSRDKNVTCPGVGDLGRFFSLPQ